MSLNRRLTEALGPVEITAPASNLVGATNVSGMDEFLDRGEVSLIVLGAPDTLIDPRPRNQELLRAGYAWCFRKYSRDGWLARLEEEARAGRRGLSADPTSDAPWDVRGRRASARQNS